MKPYQPAAPDEQMITEAILEDIARSTVEEITTRDGRSTTYLDKDGNVLAIGCGRGDREPDPTRHAQDTIETGSQIVGADDEWA